MLLLLSKFTGFLLYKKHKQRNALFSRIFVTSDVKFSR